MVGWIIGLFAGLALVVLGVICVIEILILQSHLTDPLVVQNDLSTGKRSTDGSEVLWPCRPIALTKLDYGGHATTPVTIIEAKSDVQAIVKATQLVNGTAMEVWDKTRRASVIDRCTDGLKT